MKIVTAGAVPNVTLIYLYRKVAQGSTVHSLLMDTSIRQAPVKLTPRVVPCPSLLPLFDSQ